MQSAATRRSAAPTWLLYLTFGATGIGLVLPGTLLPLLLARWGINDAQAGVLFFLFFIGSTAGAPLARGVLPRTMAIGGLGIALGAASLALAGRFGAFAAIPLYGLGLGILMTSISLLESRQYPHSRAAHMARLNLTWSVGALAGPAMLLHVAAWKSVTFVLVGIAFVFLVLGLACWAAVPHIEAPEAAPASSARRRALPLLLLAAAPLATGSESSIGSWLTTYAHRAGDTMGLTIGAVTCFWAGMLLSRLAQSHRGLTEASRRTVLLWCPCLMASAILIIIASQHGAAVTAGALLAGFGIGPLYPLLLALVLGEGEGGNLVFVTAGIGAATLPLFTGLISQAAGSLRAGLSVPLCGALTLAFIAWRLERPFATRN